MGPWRGSLREVGSSAFAIRPKQRSTSKEHKPGVLPLATQQLRIDPIEVNITFRNEIDNEIVVASLVFDLVRWRKVGARAHVPDDKIAL